MAKRVGYLAQLIKRYANKGTRIKLSAAEQTVLARRAEIYREIWPTKAAAKGEPKC